MILLEIFKMITLNIDQGCDELRPLFLCTIDSNNFFHTEKPIVYIDILSVWGLNDASTSYNKSQINSAHKNITLQIYTCRTSIVLC